MLNAGEEHNLAAGVYKLFCPALATAQSVTQLRASLRHTHIAVELLSDHPLPHLCCVDVSAQVHSTLSSWLLHSCILSWGGNDCASFSPQILLRICAMTCSQTLEGDVLTVALHLQE